MRAHNRGQINKANKPRVLFFLFSPCKNTQCNRDPPVGAAQAPLKHETRAVDRGGNTQGDNTGEVYLLGTAFCCRCQRQPRDVKGERNLPWELATEVFFSG